MESPKIRHAASRLDRLLFCQNFTAIGRVCKLVAAALLFGKSGTLRADFSALADCLEAAAVVAAAGVCLADLAADALLALQNIQSNIRLRPCNNVNDLEETRHKMCQP